LYEYFFTAFGNKEVIHKDVIKYINKKYPMPSWCGIFVWWALKKSGLPIVDWAIGLNILETMRVLPPGELPKKGYIAYRNSFQHFAMVTGVESPES
ncbi:MAG: hypothetical protein GWM98_17780, partial [Nitrospinaceae bacterium]|nr:hypothetical protein [Nitrospinaceae bacterium]NIR56000.1 hypothetical protein [Nitrospinaceae bacterium]NIS86443.1 hypothetical protein [Nitrospinaceae bacterium]NIT83281.1 hypothetical protein [Nitrospinaceae bacterium]NIU45488.1 hypothetical protein [Nitrospinaceae bacterium]